MSGPDDELTKAADALARRLPEPLSVLASIAYNYRWSWTPGGAELFSSIDQERWKLCKSNPVRLLREASAQGIERAASDDDFLRSAGEVWGTIEADLARPARSGPLDPKRPLAFFCAEYAVHQSLPIYSGGLGALAGDILKEASDMALPMVAMGLLYRQGYFRQRTDLSGWQHEYWVSTDPDRTPAALVRGDDGAPLLITVPIGDVELTAQIWKVAVGRVPLYLLDVDRPENDFASRWISARLYTGDPDYRLAQYALLGIGGIRALEAMGIDPGMIHLNEGHAAFASLELARVTQAANGANGDGNSDHDGLEAAFDAARAKAIFTTHTPVPAGNDTYPADQVAHMLRGVAGALGVDPQSLVSRGRTHPEASEEPFGVTQFALRSSRAANGVSRRHGEVAREMWHQLWPGRPVAEVPITHVTNGVHLPTWVGRPMWELLNRALGEGWQDRVSDPATWAAVDQISDEDLWAVRRQQRADLVEWVRERSVSNRLSRGESRQYAMAAAETFSPDALTLGFARRVATYKRLHLLMYDVERTLRLLGGERRVQVLIAGKAHPRDDEGKRFIQALFSGKGDPRVNANVVFLDDYDLGMAARLVQGCDVWLNVPRPPLEASGTSGMKNVVNGGLQLSVLDGWWDEAYDGNNGWALSGALDFDQGAQDARDAAELLRLLEEEVVPTFYEREGDAPPSAWLTRVRASMRGLAPQFSARRMLEEYEDKLYG
ncbi:MAG: alpha-glucan family phosphorylase [Actinomycetota bacterium]|nr:alpha-glucan family phosphorylase [Actinomycetota bacterium]